MYFLNHRVSREPIVEERKDEANRRGNFGHDAIEMVHERILLNLKRTEIVPEKRCTDDIECIALQ